MKGCPKFRALVFLVLGLVVVCPKARAQGFFINATAAPNPVQVSNAVTYTIFVTNGFPISVFANPVFITNTFTFSGSSTNLPLSIVDVTTSSNVPPVFITTNSSPASLVFGFANIVGGGVIPISISLAPSSIGTLTNQIDVLGFISGGTNSATTNLVTQVTSTGTTNPPVVVPTDLTVFFTPPVDDVFVNDSIFYTMMVSNLSSITATNVFLTNTLPANVVFKTASPAPQSTSGNILRFNLGNLASSAGKSVRVTVQAPPNAATNVFTAVVASKVATNANSTNNVATMTIPVFQFPTNDMVASFVDLTQTFIAQVTLMEQKIIVSNASPDSVSSARVTISGIPAANSLYNAVGTNSGNPFVVHGAPLGPGESVGMVLQFRVPSHTPFPLDPTNLVANAVTGFSLLPPANPGTQISFTRITHVLDRMLLELPTTNGRSYTIVYSDSMGSTNRLVARPSITATANWSYWFDFGPPETISEPMSVTSRMYQIFLNPQ
jgi:uncharacterized repeat protein (TIGR01451 family)